MRMNRRNALIGLGALAVGGGAAFGTGAFSQVAANRTVTVVTAGDASALLGIGPASRNTRYVDTTDGTFQIDLNTTLGSADGINFDALTFVEPLFQITNNGGETVGIRLGTSINTDATIVSAASEQGDGTATASVNQYQSNDGSVLFNFYAAASGSLSGTGNTFPTDLSNSQGNSIVADSFTTPGDYTNVDLQADAAVEVGLVADTRGVDSSAVSPATELLNEIRVVASSDTAAL